MRKIVVGRYHVSRQALVVRGESVRLDAVGHLALLHRLVLGGPRLDLDGHVVDLSLQLQFRLALGRNQRLGLRLPLLAQLSLRLVDFPAFHRLASLTLQLSPFQPEMK